MRLRWAMAKLESVALQYGLALYFVFSMLLAMILDP